MEWPQWLRPAQVTVPVPDSKDGTGNTVNLNAIVEKRRPLIYVYDLPPIFNSLLLEVIILCPQISLPYDLEEQHFCTSHHTLVNDRDDISKWNV